MAQEQPIQPVAQPRKYRVWINGQLHEQDTPFTDEQRDTLAGPVVNSPRASSLIGKAINWATTPFEKVSEFIEPYRQAAMDRAAGTSDKEMRRTMGGEAFWPEEVQDIVSERKGTVDTSPFRQRTPEQQSQKLAQGRIGKQEAANFIADVVEAQGSPLGVTMLGSGIGRSILGKSAARLATEAAASGGSTTAIESARQANDWLRRFEKVNRRSSAGFGAHQAYEAVQPDQSPAERLMHVINAALGGYGALGPATKPFELGPAPAQHTGPSFPGLPKQPTGFPGRPMMPPPQAAGGFPGRPMMPTPPTPPAPPPVPPPVPPSPNTNIPGLGVPPPVPPPMPPTGVNMNIPGLGILPPIRKPPVVAPPETVPFNQPPTIPGAVGANPLPGQSIVDEIARIREDIASRNRASVAPQPVPGAGVSGPIVEPPPSTLPVSSPRQPVTTPAPVTPVTPVEPPPPPPPAPVEPPPTTTTTTTTTGKGKGRGKKPAEPAQTQGPISEVITHDIMNNPKFQDLMKSISNSTTLTAARNMVTALEKTLPKYPEGSIDRQILEEGLTVARANLDAIAKARGAARATGKPAPTKREIKASEAQNLRTLRAVTEGQKLGLNVKDYSTIDELEAAIADKKGVPATSGKKKGIIQKLKEDEVGAIMIGGNEPGWFGANPNDPAGMSRFNRWMAGPGATKPLTPFQKFEELYSLARGMQGVDPAFTSSAFFRQLGPLAWTQHWRAAWPKMAKVWGDKGAYEVFKTALESRPLFTPRATFPGPNSTKPVGFASIAQSQGGLKLADVTDILRREEFNMSSIAERMPLGVGKYIRRSNEAYTTVVNHVRAMTFEDMVINNKSWDPATQTVTDPAKFRETGELVNMLTGRGDYRVRIGLNPKNRYILDVEAKQGADLLKRAVGLGFYSPRLITRNLQMLNPMTYTTLPPELRKEAAKGLLRMVGNWWTIATLGEWFLGAEVSKDPNSSDFGKMKFRNTRIDPGGGLQQYMVILHRTLPIGDIGSLAISPTQTGLGPLDLATNYLGRPGGKIVSPVDKSERVYGVGYEAPSAGSDWLQFWSNKMHPVAKAIWDYNFRGQYRPFYVGDRTAQLFVPMFTGDLAEAITEDVSLPNMGLLLGASGIGMGTQTFEGGPSQPTFGPAMEKLTGIPFGQYDILRR